MSVKTAPIFYDAYGKRKRIVIIVISILSLVISGEIALFMASLWLPPALPRKPVISYSASDTATSVLRMLPGQRDVYNERRSDKQHSQLLDSIAKENADQQPSPGPYNGIVAAFYTPWQKMGIWSLNANIDKLTHLMPEWLHLKSNGTELDFSDWDASAKSDNLDVADIARKHHTNIMPVLNNAQNGQFDAERVHNLLASPDNQIKLARDVHNWLVYEGFQGVNIDFENLYPEDYKKLPDLLKVFHQEFKEDNLMISVDLEANKDNLPLAQISETCDFVVLMAYDEHYSGGKPGPIASIGWCDRVLNKSLKSIPPDKLVIGIGNYAYDWANDKNQAEHLTYQSAMAIVSANSLSERPEDIVTFDQSALNPTFEYQDKGGKRHRVWLLDGITAYNQWCIANRRHLRGAAVWALGSEDPSLWTFLDRRHTKSRPDSRSLETVRFPRELAFDGDGELLDVRSTWHRGQRRTKIDARTGLCLKENYLHIPSPCIIHRSGYKPDALALTFEDGPNGKYTPQVLKELKRNGVRATFFVTGENAQRYPNLIRRLRSEGHEVGNHTFTHPNKSDMSKEQETWELNRAQREIVNAIGVSTRLFRPTSRARVKMAGDDGVRAIADTSKLGYVTVAGGIDPQDWKLYKPTTGGKQKKRTPEEIADSIVQQVYASRSSVVALHDGGGDRSLTAKALHIAIPKLRKAGFRFVTVSELIDQPSNAVMAPSSKRDLVFAIFSKAMLGLVAGIKGFFSIVFLLGITLGIGRYSLITVLAVIAKYRKRKVIIQDTSHIPPVSVIIPAYNERSTINRTIQSVLASDFTPVEIIVVDDGSTDGTADAVAQGFSDNNRVRLIIQRNSGKAAALNNAVSLASGEVLVCIDADTQIAQNAIGLLARYFTDLRVASVAGNVKVGNRINILTKWQSIEYVTSQNLDRRALGLLNAITVIPGAIGAWRKSALLMTGGYLTDTLAEDMDLTWRLRRLGWELKEESRAIAYTEAPSTVKALFKQRFRWAYGTLQCLWKHRTALFRHGFFGWFALPLIWTFQVCFQVLAPLIDLYIFYSFFNIILDWASITLFHYNWQPLIGTPPDARQVAFYGALFFAVELIAAVIAHRLDNERLRQLFWLFWQRFLYRQLLYAVIFKSLWMALRGTMQGWGKLERKGTVRLNLSDLTLTRSSDAQEY